MSQMRERGLHIQLLTPCYWPEVRRGTERFVHELATGLSGAGHTACVLTAARLPGLAYDEGVRVIRVPRFSERRLGARLPDNHLTHLPLAYLALRLQRCDVAHAVHAGDAAMAARWSRRSGRPAIYSHMGVPDARDLRARPGRLRLVRRAAEDCYACVVLTEAAANALEENLGHRPRVIPPGVNLQRFRVGTRRSDAPTVVFASSGDEPRKRLRLLLEAWPVVRARHPGARLLIDRRGSQRLLKRASLPTGAELCDLDDDEELTRVTGEAWAAVLPAFDEAFGLVLVEALATGTPIVAAAGGSAADILDQPEIGRLFDGTVEDLVRAVDEAFELAHEHGTRNACRARAEDFSVTRTVEAYASLYEEAVAAR